MVNYPDKRPSLLQTKDSARDKQVQNVIVIEGLANLAILILKIIVGASTGSPCDHCRRHSFV